MKKKNRTPLPLKIVRRVFPVLERLVPAVAQWYFIRIFFTPLKYPVPEKEKKAEDFARKVSVDAAGKNIQVYQWGNGKRYVLFIHGWAGRATQFRRFIKPLVEEGFCVIGFDGPAHGRSQGRRTNVMEFAEVLRKLYERFGEPSAIVAHSFGGVAALYAAANGLSIKKLVNIASPTIGDEIIRTYLRAVKGSWLTGEAFKRYMLKKYGKPFDEFSSLYFIRHLKDPINVLLVHDQDDKEVVIRHAEELMKIYPYASLIRTSGLGHTRILKDDTVIRRCVTFIRDKASPM